MGEFADDAIDRAMFMGCDWNMKYPKARRKTRTKGLVKTCNRCGEEDLRWQNVPDGMWRLHTVKGVIHDCTPSTDHYVEACDILFEEDSFVGV